MAASTVSVGSGASVAGSGVAEGAVVATAVGGSSVSAAGGSVACGVGVVSSGVPQAANIIIKHNKLKNRRIPSAPSREIYSHPLPS
jgi:hypothetical protein